MSLKQFLAIRPGFVVLMLLMILTRDSHFGNVLALPDASLATFFLAGMWFSNRYSLFLMLLVEAAVIDYLAISHFGVSDYCVSSAYGFLLPAYGVMWFFGKQISKDSSEFLSLTVRLFAALLLATTLAFLLTNGSFYWLSGKYPEANWAEYWQRGIKYYPPYLGFAMMYSVIMIALKILYGYLGFVGQSKQRA